MNHYETIFIVDPDTPAADQDAVFEKLKTLISADGKLIMFDDWGNRKLAYEIKKKKTGRYVRLDYCGNGPLVDDMERLFRLDYRILKYMSVLLEKAVDPDAFVPVTPESAEETETPETGGDAPETGEEAAAGKAEETPASEETPPEDAGEAETTEPESETEES